MEGSDLPGPGFAEMTISLASLPATRVQFGLGEVLHQSIAPRRRIEDEDENEVPCEKIG